MASTGAACLGAGGEQVLLKPEEAKDHTSSSGGGNADTAAQSPNHRRFKKFPGLDCTHTEHTPTLAYRLVQPEECSERFDRMKNSKWFNLQARYRIRSNAGKNYKSLISRHCFNDFDETSSGPDHSVSTSGHITVHHGQEFDFSDDVRDAKRSEESAGLGHQTDTEPAAGPVTTGARSPITDPQTIGTGESLMAENRPQYATHSLGETIFTGEERNPLQHAEDCEPKQGSKYKKRSNLMGIDTSANIQDSKEFLADELVEKNGMALSFLNTVVDSRSKITNVNRKEINKNVATFIAQHHVNNNTGTENSGFQENTRAKTTSQPFFLVGNNDMTDTTTKDFPCSYVLARKSDVSQQQSNPSETIASVKTPLTTGSSFVTSVFMMQNGTEDSAMPEIEFVKRTNKGTALCRDRDGDMGRWRDGEAIRESNDEHLSKTVFVATDKSFDGWPESGLHNTGHFSGVSFGKSQSVLDSDLDINVRHKNTWIMPLSDDRSKPGPDVGLKKVRIRSKQRETKTKKCEDNATVRKDNEQEQYFFTDKPGQKVKSKPQDGPPKRVTIKEPEDSQLWEYGDKRDVKKHHYPRCEQTRTTYPDTLTFPPVEEPTHGRLILVKPLAENYRGIDSSTGGSPADAVSREGNPSNSVTQGNTGSMAREKKVCKGSSVTMTTTTLPKITPCSTPLPPGMGMASTSLPKGMGITRSHSAATMYGAYPPRELSNTMDFLRMPQRINPLAPPPPRKRINWTWETTDQHFENEKRRLLMQQREHTRYHSAWSKAFYGAPADKEAYRRHFREVLKQQMDDKDTSKRDHMREKVKETEQALDYDRKCRTNDAREYFRKHAYLMQYRDTNKSLMENNWVSNKHDKVTEDRVDRERLRYNPINWSCTLK